MASHLARFSPEAGNVLRYAQEETVRLGRNMVGTEHMLLALIREQAGLAGRVLGELGLALGPARAAVAQLTGPDQQLGGAVALTLGVKRALEQAVDAAERTSPAPISTGHLLLGLVYAGGVGTDVLRHFGLEPETVRERVSRELARTGGAEQIGPDLLEEGNS